MGDNYDSENQEVFEEPLSFQVNADLEAELLEQPSGTSFHYGNEAVYRFRVKDKLTGSTVGMGNRGGVFLALSHYDEAKGKSYVSTKLPAERNEDDDLVINWLVNPNAVSGKGSLSPLRWRSVVTLSRISRCTLLLTSTALKPPLLFNSIFLARVLLSEMSSSVLLSTMRENKSTVSLLVSLVTPTLPAGTVSTSSLLPASTPSSSSVRPINNVLPITKRTSRSNFVPSNVRLS